MAVEVSAGLCRNAWWCAGRHGEQDLDVAQVNPRVEHDRDPCYLYLIPQSSWQRPVLACEGREARKAEKMAAKKRCLVLVLLDVPHRVPDTREARAG